MHVLSTLGVHYIAYTAIGYGFAICCSFFLNLKFTFNVGKATKTRFLKFISISGMNLLLVELIEVSLIEHMQVRELFAIMTGMIWYTLSGFILNKFLVYTKSS
jgi:putative flippase GtrA